MCALASKFRISEMLEKSNLGDPFFNGHARYLYPVLRGEV